MVAKEFDQAILLTKIKDIVKPIINELEGEYEELRLAESWR
jgi:hypothetical protein